MKLKRKKKLGAKKRHKDSRNSRAKKKKKKQNSLSSQSRNDLVTVNFENRSLAPTKDSIFLLHASRLLPKPKMKRLGLRKDLLHFRCRHR